MKMEVVKETENKLLHRKELNIVLSDLGGVPSKKEILSLVSANLGTSELNLVLGSVRQEYGARRAECSMKVYESEEHKKGIEPKPKEKKKGEEGESK